MWVQHPEMLPASSDRRRRACRGQAGRLNSRPSTDNSSPYLVSPQALEGNRVRREVFSPAPRDGVSQTFQKLQPRDAATGMIQGQPHPCSLLFLVALPYPRPPPPTGFDHSLTELGWASRSPAVTPQAGTPAHRDSLSLCITAWICPPACWAVAAAPLRTQGEVTKEKGNFGSDCGEVCQPRAARQMHFGGQWKPPHPWLSEWHLRSKRGG